ncbi:XTP/dITP diphosphohydrolase [Aurantimicrobium minutum]|uniref:dITP/XTP pyrophosphatase n=1 Tax=Aurantimicrobium photophilum TaxID=1987356 RepID=A0A2Z3RZ68_9MICO|nr:MULTISPECIES: RdgB/HAM1 family non-canonical purine NTP pyrophosphatase [Aurantimicrobium]AWR21760.1 Non-canonical purine NTP pyrophosphatase [Aurantimicrobium photophilum]MDF9810138.1 XTP/dITP diphosphohydrolase [Aurantimicrobium minutum]MDH6424413.1 XTP/dITP diphosphohydrolase [Aurantimicrobium minutum]
MNTFVLATHNQHKIEEFNAILGELVPGINVIGYDGPEPIEDGVSFAENALIKARAAAAHTGLPSLSDDSGICVDVLGGMPGIFSARWAGNAKDNAANVQLLLDQMSDVRDSDRGAHFTCHIAVVIPETQEEFVVVGNWPGTIAREVHGVNGFGYDPVFIPEGFEVTAAILDPAEKNKLSHRSRALQALADRLSS